MQGTKPVSSPGTSKDTDVEDGSGTPESVLVSGHPSDSDIGGLWILTLRLSNPGDSEEGSRVFFLIFIYLYINFLTSLLEYNCFTMVC